jgi:hypothetical protein
MIRKTTIVLALAGLLPVLACPASLHAQVSNPRGVALGIGGETRVRFESLDPQFRPGPGASDQVLALRTRLTLEAAWPKWRLLGEIVDSRAELNGSRSVLNTGIVNTLEPVTMAAVRSWSGLLTENSAASLRFGRLTVDLGSRRLLARNRFRSARRKRVAGITSSS